MKKYKCLFNHELVILSLSQTPYQSYDENLTDIQAIGMIKELEDTDVDVIMCCPTAWRCNLWHSKVDPHWEQEARVEKEPLPEHDWTYAEKAYYRLRRYMLTGADPFGVSVKTAHETGKDIFASYRMNDNHYVWDKECPTHNRFYLEHRDECKLKYEELWRGRDCLNYKYEAVRDYYYNILRELLEMYDVDGLELDFMRALSYFDPEDIQEGLHIMTEFVRRIRTMVNEFSQNRNKRLQLCVRVPHTLKRCKDTGLDVETWDREGLIDMVNISSHFIITPYLGIEEFKKHISNASLYGELHFALKSGKYDSGFSNNVLRKTTKVIYRTLANNFIHRGCDGISLFNFDYVRDYHFNDPRREGLNGFEPPFEALKNIDIDIMKNEPKHYFVHGYSDIAKKVNEAEIPLHISENTQNGVFKKAIARVETEEKCMELDIKMYLNGIGLTETNWLGELFIPQSVEVLPSMDHVRYFEVPLNIIQQGDNIFKVINATKKRGLFKHIKFIAFELGIYTDKPIWE